MHVTSSYEQCQGLIFWAERRIFSVMSWVYPWETGGKTSVGNEVSEVGRSRSVRNLGSHTEELGLIPQTEGCGH